MIKIAIKTKHTNRIKIIFAHVEDKVKDNISTTMMMMVMMMRMG